MTDAAKSAARDLRMIYREIPQATGCKKGCSDCCGPVPWTKAELDRVRHKIPAVAKFIDFDGTPALLNPLTMQCPFVAPGGGCTVYEHRPLMCRLYAATDAVLLTCPHGCKAKRPLTERRADSLIARYQATGPAST